MKLTTEPSALAGAVRFAARALNARAAYPILGGLKITVGSDGNVEVSAFDYRRRRPAGRGGQAAGGRGRPGDPVRLAIMPEQIELTAGNGDEADGSDTIGCELDGDPLTVAFHPCRLLDAITATGTGRARIAPTIPAKAVLITPADGGPDDDAGPAYWHLLTPIRSAG